jgi:hypothetical protein
VVVSTDGGAHTSQVMLDSPDGPATVTATVQRGASTALLTVPAP